MFRPAVFLRMARMNGNIFGIKNQKTGILCIQKTIIKHGKICTKNQKVVTFHLWFHVQSSIIILYGKMRVAV